MLGGRPPTCCGPDSHSSFPARARSKLIGAGGDRARRRRERRIRAGWACPLQAEDRTVGVLVVQSYTAEHQYTERDRDLLAFVGQHVGAALSRARAIEETRQRNAELALINSVQAALAGELELQAIYDVVGDKIQEVFDAQVVDIGIYDEAAGLIHFPYTIERGVRFPDEPIELIGFRKHVMETREPLMIAESTPEVAERYGNPFVLAGEPARSALFVPLVVGGRATGVISLQNLDREHAFTDADQRLLTTLAGSLSVALENARLVHETRQRNAELALINSVQEAIAGELELAGDLRRRRRQDPGGLRRPGRRHRRLRRGLGTHPLPVRDRARSSVPGRAFPDRHLVDDAACSWRRRARCWSTRTSGLGSRTRGSLGV